MFVVLTLLFVMAADVIAQESWIREVLADNVISGWTRVADVDGDSDTDVFVQHGDTLFWYENLEPGWTKHLIDAAFMDVPYSWVEEVDLDADGDQDVLHAEFTNPGEVGWNENKKNGAEWERHVITPAGRGNGAFQRSVADVNSDGHPDVILPEFNAGQITWYELSADSVTWNRHSIGPLSSALWTTVDDMDNDGDMDVVAGSGSSGGVHWFENQYPDTVWADHYVASLLGSWMGEAIDLNGDGATDIVTHNATNLIAYMGPLFGVSILADGFTSLQMGRLGDIDMDEDIDVTFGGDGFGSSGDIGWLENPGSAGSWVRHDVAQASLLQRIPTGLADIDLDGHIDMTSFEFNVATTISDAVWFANPGPVSTVGSVEATVVPSEVILAQNYPNPFNPETSIRFGLPERTSVTLSVVNVLGQRVAVLKEGSLEGGFHEVKFRPERLPSGLYFYELRTPNGSVARRMTFLR